MTNEEAKLILERYIPKPSRGNGKSTQTLIITEAILLAIKALDEQINTQRPKVKWIFTKTIFDKYGYTVECPSCHKKWKTYDEIRWKKKISFAQTAGKKWRR